MTSKKFTIAPSTITTFKNLSSFRILMISKSLSRSGHHSQTLPSWKRLAVRSIFLSKLLSTSHFWARINTSMNSSAKETCQCLSRQNSRCTSLTTFRMSRTVSLSTTMPDSTEWTFLAASLSSMVRSSIHSQRAKLSKISKLIKIARSFLCTGIKRFMMKWMMKICGSEQTDKLENKWAKTNECQKWRKILGQNYRID